MRVGAIIHDARAGRRARARARGGGLRGAGAGERAPGGRAARARRRAADARARGSWRSRCSSAARLERDLHDGAQQRLVALSLQLGLAQKMRARGSRARPRRLLDAAREELARALEELRELARGIHPAVLTDRGLEPALEALADAGAATG